METPHTTIVARGLPESRPSSLSFQNILTSLASRKIHPFSYLAPNARLCQPRAFWSAENNLIAREVGPRPLPMPGLLTAERITLPLVAVRARLQWGWSAPASEGTDCRSLIPIMPHISVTMSAPLPSHIRKLEAIPWDTALKSSDTSWDSSRALDPASH